MILAKALVLVGLLVTGTMPTNKFDLRGVQGIPGLHRAKRDTQKIKSNEIDGLLKNYKNGNGGSDIVGLSDHKGPILKSDSRTTGTPKYFYDGCFRCILVSDGNLICKENRIGCGLPITSWYDNQGTTMTGANDEYGLTYGSYSVVKVKSGCWKCNVAKPWLPCERLDPCPGKR